MTNDPWGPAPGYPPPPNPEYRYPDYYTGQFGIAAPSHPPGLAATIVVTLLTGVFGVIPASLHASRARLLGHAPGRYWKAFGITFGAVFTGQVLLVGGLFAAGVVSLSQIIPPGTASGTSAGARPVSSSTVSREPVVPPRTQAPPPVPRERTGREQPSRSPGLVSIVTGSAGKSCATSTDLSGWGGYPLAGCRTWKESSGLLTGATLSKKDLTITCQADLQEQNPVYTVGQTNTWWVWTQADNGTWDWFPETAIAQGASNQPVNGIARCH
jgi:hypothetical protein